MSTIVAVKKAGVATLGADTLVKFGDSKESAEFTENFSKVLQVGENYLAFVGHASFGLILSSYFDKLADIPPMNNRQEIFELACQLHTTLKKDYFLNPNEEDDDSFESSQLDCLIVNPAGVFGLYSLRFVQEYSKFCAFGSGSQYALGAMHCGYDNLKGSDEIAMAGLKAAADFDDGTGAPFEMHTVLGPS